MTQSTGQKKGSTRNVPLISSCAIRPGFIRLEQTLFSKVRIRVIIRSENLMAWNLTTL
jgi:hypothetical protein